MRFMVYQFSLSLSLDGLNIPFSHGFPEGHRFDLRFFRPFRADLSIKKSSSFFPPLISATSHLGFAPRPAQVSPEGLRYFAGTFLPLNAPLRPTLAPPTTAILSNCSISLARCSTSISSTRSRRSMSASTVIPDRFIFGIVISGGKNGIVCEALTSKSNSISGGRFLRPWALPWQMSSLATPKQIGR
jgi:hypothetical protein